jgi:hypothetical protein
MVSQTPTCLIKFFSSNSLLFQEMSGLELDPQIDEAPSKGGLGVNFVIRERLSC